MKKTYQNDHCTINLICGDSLEALRGMEENQYDLAIVDPPYGIDIEQRVFKDEKKWDILPPELSYFSKLMIVSNNQIIWGGNYFIDYLKSTRCYLTWDKKITDSHKLSMTELAWTSFNTVSKTFYLPPQVRS